MKEAEKNLNELNLILLEDGKLALSYDLKGDTSERQIAIQEKFAEVFSINPVEALFQLGFMEARGVLSATLNFFHEYSQSFINALRLTEQLDMLRDKAEIACDEESLNELLSNAPFFAGSEFLNIEVLRNYWKALEDFYKVSIKTFTGTPEEFLKTYSDKINVADKIYFHMVENKKGSSTPFAFLATYSAGAAGKGVSQHRPLKSLMDEYSGKHSKFIEMLSSVYRAANKSSYIKNLLEGGEIFYPIGVDSNDAFTFLSETPTYEECGILCRIPNWWKTAKRGIRISAKFGNNEKTLLGMKSLIDFKMSLTVDGKELSHEEVEKILIDSAGLTMIKGKWVALDKEKLSATLDKWNELQHLIDSGELSLSEAFRIVSGMDEKYRVESEVEDSVIDFGFGDWMKTLMEKMSQPLSIEKFPVGKDFKADLRPYQSVGVNWLGFLSSMNLGACLADDMGLGKTVQIIALLSGSVSKSSKKPLAPSLLVVPASLMHNWASEIRKFAPTLKFAFAHPSWGEQSVGENPLDSELEKQHLIITTYSFVKKYKWLADRKWQYLILDEAQAIKNHGSLQTKAVKSLQAEKKIALTGTPIENSLWDLWSIFDFLNPGLLGSAAQFKKVTSEKNEHRFGQIRKIITPYILRRLKSDRKIISDLPDKIEMDAYTRLSKKQLILYKKQVDELIALLDKSVEGIQRKGLVLSSIMKFKQICNHPSQFNGEKEFLESDSGKFERLREICEVIKEKRERALIFTQFKEMTGPLNEFLSSLFNAKGFVLHGGTSIKQRKEMVEAFQSDQYYPYFILSLKAGGTGLNLTKANHVIHFDRWWNPAVENQATDRAFRIGQKKSVVAHKFICEGTFEEKIDQMLKEKSKLSANILSDTEGVNLTELTNEEIKTIFKPGVIYE